MGLRRQLLVALGLLLSLRMLRLVEAVCLVQVVEVMLGSLPRHRLACLVVVVVVVVTPQQVVSALRRQLQVVSALRRQLQAALGPQRQLLVALGLLQSL